MTRESIIKALLKSTHKKLYTNYIHYIDKKSSLISYAYILNLKHKSNTKLFLMQIPSLVQIFFGYCTLFFTKGGSLTHTHNKMVTMVKYYFLMTAFYMLGAEVRTVGSELKDGLLVKIVRVFKKVLC